MVRLRKRSDWFLNPTLDSGASPSVMHDSYSPLLHVSDYETRPIHAQSPSLLAKFNADPPSYSSLCNMPHVCVNDLDVVDLDTGATRQHHADEGYSSRSAVTENSTSLFPTPTENSFSSPATSTVANSRPNASSESSLASAKHLLQSDTHYFLVDRFYGGSSVTKKAENGDTC